MRKRSISGWRFRTRSSGRPFFRAESTKVKRITGSGNPASGSPACRNAWRIRPAISPSGSFFSAAKLKVSNGNPHDYQMIGRKRKSLHRARRPHSSCIAPPAESARGQGDDGGDGHRRRAAEDHRGHGAQPLRGQARFDRAPLIGGTDE